ncbi:MAG TPA: hypothetical protein DEB69_01110 [Candidatus Komeilibacteria bacterium]|nr:MAG: hypothetical protein UW98_C0008G0034 [Parcubacteria group bacterium GW2011_GWC2_45_15]OGY93998.1 MAG: hypothetical protein A3J95_02210 [Candidatus Komeilibacteria bacterium RIFOXYC2_FULL_45_12]OGY94399.1 MAG: hypothetical protein A2260_00670 [Candidatus Komeilibacteria bacterium RIFOXYA2_FULL_45_9]HBR13181.1 hypothetical protein [Candidatus Komeilibacteria bacterium]HBV02004.1 hypothetical protein [Candidatus Komeilibacteria bacterium]
MIKIKKNQAGFTLVEMMVMLVIFAVIFTLSLVNYRKGERLEVFRLATSGVASAIRQAQTSALTGFGSEADLSPAYGVYFDLAAPDQYLFFKDDDNNQAYSAGLDEVIETVFLPAEIELSGYTGDGPVSIVFIPPKPTTYFTSGLATFQSGEITLRREEFSTKEGLITLNTFTGQVSAKLQEAAE